MAKDEFHPFSGEIKSQDGIVYSEDYHEITPKEIVMMDWLVDNINGRNSDDEGTERKCEISGSCTRCFQGKRWRGEIV